MIRKLTIWVINNLNNDLLLKLLRIIIRKLSINSDYYVTYIERPKKIERPNLKTVNNEFSDVALIIQGPIIFEDNFTLNSVIHYKKNYRNINIILATWKDYSQGELNDFDSLDIDILKLEKPLKYGKQNINLQIITTLNGIKLADKKGIKFSIKTRTDQRIFNTNLRALINSIDLFPMEKLHKVLENRIIVTSMSTLKYRPYGITDMFMIGYTQDLLTYWNIPLDSRQLFPKSETVKEYAINRFAETYIMSHFAEKIFAVLDYSLKQTWELYRDYFIIIDKHTIDIFWFKYSIEKENRLDNYIFNIFNEMSFIEWLELKNKDLNNLDEHILNFPINISKYVP